MFEQTHEAFLAQQKKKTLRIVDHLEGDTMHEWLLLVKPRGRTTIRARTSMPGFEFAMYGEDYPEQAAYIQKQIAKRDVAFILLSFHIVFPYQTFLSDFKKPRIFESRWVQRLGCVHFSFASIA